MIRMGFYPTGMPTVDWKRGAFYVYCYYMQHLHGGPHFSCYLIKSYPNGTVVMLEVVPLNQDSPEPHTLSLV